MGSINEIKVFQQPRCPLFLLGNRALSPICLSYLSPICLYLLFVPICIRVIHLNLFLHENCSESKGNVNTSEKSFNKRNDLFYKGTRIYRLAYKSTVRYVFYLFSACCHYRSSHKNYGNIACLFVFS